MINESISAVTHLIVDAPVSIWFKMLALMGVVYLINSVAKTGINVINIIFYVIGFIKFIVNKIRGMD
jgi:hypothetical protein